MNIIDSSQGKGYFELFVCAVGFELNLIVKDKYAVMLAFGWV